MSEFQLLMICLGLLGINFSILVASFIIRTAINDLVKTIKEKKNNE